MRSAVASAFAEASSPRSADKSAQRQVDGRVQVRLAGILRRPRHRHRARTRLHADRAERKRRGSGRVGKRRAPVVAGSRRRRQVLRLEPDPATRHASARRSAASVAQPRRRRHRSRRRRLPARQIPSKPVVYVPIGADAARTSLTMRVHGDPERASGALVERLTAIDPNMGEVFTLRLHPTTWRRTFCGLGSG